MFINVNCFKILIIKVLFIISKIVRDAYKQTSETTFPFSRPIRVQGEASKEIDISNIGI